MKLIERSKILKSLLEYALEEVGANKLYAIESINAFDKCIDSIYSSNNKKKATFDDYLIRRFKALFMGRPGQEAVDYHKLKQGYEGRFMNVWTDGFTSDIYLSYNIDEADKIVTLLFFGPHCKNPMYRNLGK